MVMFTYGHGIQAETTCAFSNVHDRINEAKKIRGTSIIGRQI
jgi:hypothetical protein